MKMREDASILPDSHFTGCVDCIDAYAATLRPLLLDDHQQRLDAHLRANAQRGKAAP